MKRAKDVCNSLFESEEDDEKAKAEETKCPTCGGECTSLGKLGKRAHFRCKMCGFTFPGE